MHRISHRRIVTRACAAVGTLALLVTVALPGGSASAAVPAGPVPFTGAIEAPTPYVEQSSCDPRRRAGTAALGDLLVMTYPGTSWASAYGCGTDGAISEHYEGRAIDWMVSVHNRHQHQQAFAFRTWLLATDQAGNAQAMARRLGVMYVIWNNRMWGTWDGRWQEYNGCQAAAMQSSAYDNACHRTHMHISLSWNGARGRTTFWTGTVHPTDYGPCRVGTQRYAAAWTAPNRTPCPGR